MLVKSNMPLSKVVWRRRDDLLIFRPLLRAYGLAFLSSAGPRLVKLLVAVYIQGLGGRVTLNKIYHILSTSRFPFFAGALVGAYTSLQGPLKILLELFPTWLAGQEWRINNQGRVALSRFLAAFLASWICLPVLNTKVGGVSKNRNSSSDEMTTSRPSVEVDSSRNVRVPNINFVPASITLVGRTMDLTLLVVIRALDTVISELWYLHKISRASKGKWTAFESLSGVADAGLFAISSGLVMFAWFYHPERLPRAYNVWIGEAAQVDRRLIQVLRNARRGDFVYGLDTGQAELLQSMCKDYGWPLIWGDPAQTIPIPCEMVHMGAGNSCHRHAVVRFFRAFRFALAMHLPIQLLVKAKNPSIKSLKLALRHSIRSSAFLGAFISLFYYSVCLTRTKIGPKIFARTTITPMMWDKGLCIQAGCILCGWSILIEAQKRRQEVALFVAPRAVATLLPRRYERKSFWREQLAFSLGTGILFTFAHEDPAKVRGVLGQVLHRILQ